MAQGAGLLAHGAGPTVQGARPLAAQGAGPPGQGAGPPVHGAGPLAQGARPLAKVAGQLTQGARLPMQGVRLAPTTIPHLDEAEPELEADLEGERPDLDPQGDPGPEHPEESGPDHICKWYCVCMYGNGMCTILPRKLSSPLTITFCTMIMTR